MATLLLSPSVGAQAPPLGKFKPSDVYFQAWLTVRDAEKAEKDGKFLEAFNRYDKARQLFESVALSNPEFKPDLVKTRRESTTQAMSAIREKALGYLDGQLHAVVTEFTRQHIAGKPCRCAGEPAKIQQ